MHKQLTSKNSFIGAKFSFLEDNDKFHSEKNADSFTFHHNHHTNTNSDTNDGPPTLSDWAIHSQQEQVQLDGGGILEIPVYRDPPALGDHDPLLDNGGGGLYEDTGGTNEEIGNGLNDHPWYNPPALGDHDPFLDTGGGPTDDTGGNQTGDDNLSDTGPWVYHAPTVELDPDQPNIHVEDTAEEEFDPGLHFAYDPPAGQDTLPNDDGDNGGNNSDGLHPQLITGEVILDDGTIAYYGGANGPAHAPGDGDSTTQPIHPPVSSAETGDDVALIHEPDMTTQPVNPPVEQVGDDLIPLCGTQPPVTITFADDITPIEQPIIHCGTPVPDAPTAPGTIYELYMTNGTPGIVGIPLSQFDWDAPGDKNAPILHCGEPLPQGGGADVFLLSEQPDIIHCATPVPSIEYDLHIDTTAISTVDYVVCPAGFVDIA